MAVSLHRLFFFSQLSTGHGGGSLTKGGKGEEGGEGAEALINKPPPSVTSPFHTHTHTRPSLKGKPDVSLMQTVNPQKLIEAHAAMKRLCITRFHIVTRETPSKKTERAVPVYC